MANDLVQANQTFGQYLVTKKKQLEMALPKHLNVDRMLRLCMTEISKNPKLKECTTPSLFGAIIQSAQLGLEPGGHLGHAYLIPFRNNKKNCYEAQFLVGYKGMIDLARRSGNIVSISARCVYEKDEFSFEYGLDEKLTHKPAKEEPGQIVAAYAVAKLKDGGIQFEVMWKAEIDEIRKGSKSADNGPWVTDFAEMAKKTVIRRLFKYLPVSIEMQKAVTLDEMAEKDISQNNDSVIEDAAIEVEGRTVETANDLNAKVRDAAIKPNDFNENFDKS